MSTLKYVGPQHSGVEVRVGDDYVPVKHRGVVELPGDVAKNLLRNQPELWDEVTKKDEDA